MTTLGEWAGELAEAIAGVQAATRPVIARAANETKARMKQEASGHPGSHGLESTISYDMTNGGLGFECGPVKGGSGSLAFYYYGNSKVNASIPDPVIALNDEAEKTLAYLATAVTAVLK